jgi:hypothetical protein
MGRKDGKVGHLTSAGASAYFSHFNRAISQRKNSSKPFTCTTRLAKKFIIAILLVAIGLAMLSACYQTGLIQADPGANTPRL